MNKLEKIIYDLVKHQPGLKLAIRNGYQRIFDILPSRDTKSKYPILVRDGFFFGFHDINPFSNDNKHLLTNKSVIPHRMPNKNDILKVGFFSGISYDEFNEIGMTKAWNYHKGCRLQWVGNSKNIIFNDFNNSIISKIINIETREERQLDWPIDTVSPNGLLATSFSYSRLEKLMPGYGYLYEDDNFLSDCAPVNTGIYILNLAENKRMMLLSLADIANYQKDQSMVNARHFVTHSFFSPDSKYVSFLHRWVMDDVKKRKSRLIVCSTDGKEIYISPTNGMVSHYVWNKHGNIIAYCNINGIDSHVLFNEYSMKTYRQISYPYLNSDGHQHFNPNGTCFVTDTYPDKRRYAKLFIVNIQNQKVIKIAEVKSPRKYQSIFPDKHWACDLHPRWNGTGDILCFDSVHTGTRSLCTIKLDSAADY